MLPENLEPFEDAIEIGVLRTDSRGLWARGHDASRFEPTSKLSSYDGFGRRGFYDAGTFVRFDLAHPVVPATLSAALRASHAELVGTDGALYEYEWGWTSQLTNRTLALARLAYRVRKASSSQRA